MATYNPKRKTTSGTEDVQFPISAVKNLQTTLDNKLSKSGGTLTGSVTAPNLQSFKVANAGTENTDPMWVAVFNNNDSKQGLSYSSLANLFKKYTYTLPNRIASYQASANVKTNPNDAVETGFYYVNGETNRPPFSQSANADYRLLVTAYSDIWLQQIATDFRCDDIFYRRKQNGTWTSWIRLAKASEVSSLSNDVKGNSEDITNLINTVNSEVERLQTQIDGSITTWFYEVPPTISNAPAKDWTTTDLKNVHLGDIYYDTITGYCYRWQVVNNVYSWQRITDTDVTKALNDSAKAQETADIKRRVFYSTPTVPYDKGDLWVGGSTGDIKYCTTAKVVGQSYAASDWSLASKYTDDTVANAAKTTADEALPKSGGTVTGKLIVSGGVDIRGSAASLPLKVRGIVGSDGNGTVADLYLQYGANATVKFGSTGAYQISADGSSYTGTAAKATRDGSGNVITTTYATKTELTNAIASAITTALSTEV